MIEAIRGKGVNRAKVICDDCGRSDPVTCDYSRNSAGDWDPNEGQIIRKIEAQGWALVKGRLRCKTCEGKRKAMNAAVKKPEPVAAAKVEAPREPTPKQKREIIGVLEVVYDDTRKRYKDGESDKSVAEAIGGGILWGWVARIRDDLFGPDTRNQELEAIRKAVAEIEKDIAASKSKSDAAIASLEAKVSAITRDLERAIQ